MVEDGGALMRDLSLGQAVVKDFANYRVLDKLMLYERRMENSMVKMIRELRKLQAERETEQPRAASCRGRLARASRGHLAHDWGQPSQTDPRPTEHQSAQESPSARGQRGDLKKQSQYAAAQMNAKSSSERAYDETPVVGEAGNKANQSELQTPQRARPGGKGEIVAAVRASQ
jgi:hypothetical protein